MCDANEAEVDRGLRGERGAGTEEGEGLRRHWPAAAHAPPPDTPLDAPRRLRRCFLYANPRLCVDSLISMGKYITEQNPSAQPFKSNTSPVICVCQSSFLYFLRCTILGRIRYVFRTMFPVCGLLFDLHTYLVTICKQQPFIELESKQII